jgi:hypothetical protein
MRAALELLARIAVVVDYHQCHDSQENLQTWKHRSPQLCGDLILRFCITYVFNQAPTIHEILRFVVREARGHLALVNNVLITLGHETGNYSPHPFPTRGRVSEIVTQYTHKLTSKQILRGHRINFGYASFFFFFFSCTSTPILYFITQSYLRIFLSAHYRMKSTFEHGLMLISTNRVFRRGVSTIQSPMNSGDYVLLEPSAQEYAEIVMEQASVQYYRQFCYHTLLPPATICFGMASLGTVLIRFNGQLNTVQETSLEAQHRHHSSLQDSTSNIAEQSVESRVEDPGA